jgi:hypothetical protein
LDISSAKRNFIRIILNDATLMIQINHKSSHRWWSLLWDLLRECNLGEQSIGITPSWNLEDSKLHWRTDLSEKSVPTSTSWKSLFQTLLHGNWEVLQFSFNASAAE